MSAGENNDECMKLWKRTLINAVRVAVGLVFFVSGWSHLQNEMLFYADIRACDLVAERIIPFFSIVLLCLHIFVGAALIIGKFGFAASFTGSCTLLVFLSAQIWSMAMGKSID